MTGQDSTAAPSSMSASFPDMANKVAVITGGAGALAQAIAALYLQRAAVGILLVDQDSDQLEGAIDALGSDRVLTHRGDVRDPDDLNSAVDLAVNTYGRVDVMINNAGVLGATSRLHELSAADWERTIAVNLLGTINGTAAALRHMRPARSGSIINTASIAAVAASPQSGPYGVTKAAVVQLTKVNALEYAPDGIRVNCVCPGSFDSALFQQIPARMVPQIAARYPLGLGNAATVAGAYLYLGSELSAWSTGTVLVTDGGASIH